MTFPFLLLLILVIYFCKDKSQLLHIIITFLFIIYLYNQYEGLGVLGAVTSIVDFNDLPLEEICDYGSDMIVNLGCDGIDTEEQPCKWRVMCDEFACEGEHLAALATAGHTYVPTQNSQCSIGRYHFDKDWLKQHEKCKPFINSEEDCSKLACVLSDGMCIPDSIRIPQEIASWCGQFGTGDPEKPLEDCEEYTENNPAENICKIINKLDEDGNPTEDEECVYIRRDKYKNNLCQDLMTTPDCTTFLDQATCDPDFCEWGPDPNIPAPPATREEAYTRKLEEARADVAEAQRLIDEANADSSPGYEERTDAVEAEQTPIKDTANALIASLVNSQASIDSKQAEIDLIINDDSFTCDCETIDPDSQDDSDECVQQCNNISTLQGELDSLIEEQDTLTEYDVNQEPPDNPDICYDKTFLLGEMGKSNIFKQRCESYEFDENITKGEEHKCSYGFDCTKDNPNQCKYNPAPDSECPLPGDDPNCYDEEDASITESICSSSNSDSDS